MAARVLRLYPGPPEEVALPGLYLAHRLHAAASPPGHPPGYPFVYASFVGSLDGRIALVDPGTGASHVPPGLGSANDFRLLQELQAQADIFVTNAGYLRDLAAGRLDDILQVGAGDLAAWRAANGLPPQPAVAVVSSSLDFTLPASLARHGQRVVIAVGAAAPASKVDRWRRDGHEVVVAGEGASVQGGPLARELGRRGFRSAYLLSGPRMLETALRDGVLSRLYLTMTHRLFGGEHVHTMLSGPPMGAAGRLRLRSLHYDATSPEGAGQWFAEFEPSPAGTAAAPPPLE